MHLANVFNDHGATLDSESFGNAAYFGQIIDGNGTARTIRVSEALEDVALRWRMFFFHYYFTVAHENQFFTVVDRANLNRLTGITIEDILKPLSSKSFDTDFRKLIKVD